MARIAVLAQPTETLGTVIVVVLLWIGAQEVFAGALQASVHGLRGARDAAVAAE